MLGRLRRRLPGVLLPPPPEPFGDEVVGEQPPEPQREERPEIPPSVFRADPTLHADRFDRPHRRGLEPPNGWGGGMGGSWGDRW
jgi:hypothetical protein